MNLDDAEVGVRYKVTMDDYCVEGTFESEVTAKNYVPDPPPDGDGEPFLESVTFANGVTLTEWLQVDAVPMQVANTPVSGKINEEKM